jgi:sulfide dehydrogenase [flavocytochrome c] flavoprotein subunit
LDKRSSSGFSEFGARREFVKGAIFASLSMWLPLKSFAKTRGRVVIVGGGIGGIACARYLKEFAPSLTVTLIEKNSSFVTCPFSNTVLGLLNEISFITHSYSALSSSDIKFSNKNVIGIDADKKSVKCSDGSEIFYDKLVISPGIEMIFDFITGYSEKTAEVIPHAWKAGSQTLLLKSQIMEMPDGGLIIITVPNNPYRCPPGPYERASLIANYLSKHKPKSKILILDNKDNFSKQNLFFQGWKKLYPGLIEWIPFRQIGNPLNLNVPEKELNFEFGTFRSDVINIIPPQKASSLLVDTGLINKGELWCRADQKTFASAQESDIHVIGDAVIAGDMPKSAFSAMSQAKICAYNLAAIMSGHAAVEVPLINTCYSLLSESYGISVTDVYRLSKNLKLEKIKGAGGTSDIRSKSDVRELEALYANGWYKNMIADLLG